MDDNTKCLICDLVGDHETDECPFGDGTDEGVVENPVWEPCEICGERYDERRPNAGDGWAEMGDPNDLSAPSVSCHYACGEGRGLELA